MADIVALPTTTEYVDQRVFVSPLGGPSNPINYLDRFPDEVYSKAPDSHLVKFLYTLMGPAGVGWTRKNYLQARLRLEDFGLELFDLDRFFGNPFQFGRIFEEIYDQDPRGLLSREDWDRIRGKDTHYRNRALDFLAGVRLGNTPKGMEFVAKAGLGHEVEIVENYRSLYDEHSDDPMGLTFYGQTRSTEEMIVLPRREVSTSEIQTITITGAPTGGTFRIYFNGELTGHIGHDATSDVIQSFLETLNGIAVGDVEVYGGPGPSEPWRIYFVGQLAAQDVPQMSTENYLTGGTSPQIITRTTQSGISATDEVASIAPRAKYHLQQAIDRIRPQTTIPTVGEATGLRSPQVWNTVTASSEYDEPIRYVTGNTNITWPTNDSHFWIRGGVEKEAPRSKDGMSYHYTGWHTPLGVIAYTDTFTANPAYNTGGWDELDFVMNRSEHQGDFSPLQRLIYPMLGDPPAPRYTADRALADYAEPLLIRESSLSDRQLINGIYPIEYVDLPGVPPIKYRDEQYWASLEREEGTDYLEIDLGRVQAVNYLSFEITRKPVDIAVDYDLLDLGTSRRWQPVSHPEERAANTTIGFSPENQSPWVAVSLAVTNLLGRIIYTRHLRIGFTRRNDDTSPFKDQTTNYPWSIEVRNLRVGRNITNNVKG